MERCATGDFGVIYHLAMALLDFDGKSDYHFASSFKNLYKATETPNHQFLLIVTFYHSIANFKNMNSSFG
jgi:hypothetical protein